MQNVKPRQCLLRISLHNVKLYRIYFLKWVAHIVTPLAQVFFLMRPRAHVQVHVVAKWKLDVEKCCYWMRVHCAYSHESTTPVQRCVKTEIRIGNPITYLFLNNEVNWNGNWTSIKNRQCIVITTCFTDWTFFFPFFLTFQFQHHAVLPNSKSRLCCPRVHKASRLQAIVSWCACLSRTKHDRAARSVGYVVFAMGL